MDEQAFKQRTKKLALRVIELVEALPKSRTGDVIGRQLLRCGTSVGANYRSACRGKSTADVLAKLAIVEEEADETIYWLELLIEANIKSASDIEGLLKETNEIVAMTVASNAQMKPINNIANGTSEMTGNPKSKMVEGAYELHKG